MCLAVPMKIKNIRDYVAEVEVDNISTEVNISLIEKPEIDDYVIVHAGFAIEKLDKKEAETRLELFNELVNKNELH